MTNTLKTEREHAATDEPLRELVDGVHRLDYQLTEVRRDLHDIRRRIPGTLTIAVGVMFGLVLYSVLGILVTALVWSQGIDWYLRNHPPGASQTQGTHP